MNFKELMQKDIDFVYFQPSELAVTISYSPSGTSVPYDINAVLTRGGNPTMQFPIPPTESIYATVKYQDVPFPEYRDVYKYDGDEYFLKGVVEGGKEMGIWILEISKSRERGGR
jgi:hypothetical protein